MKVHILFKFIDGPWGGGNQFLKCLRKYFVDKGCYEEVPEKADAILFNSHHCLEAVLRLKVKFPHVAFIHRVDGPVFLIRGRNREIDSLIFRANQLLADGTVFQSNWSRTHCLQQGMRPSATQVTITNAPDPQWFYPAAERRASSGKIRLIATSWSANMKKGFDIYHHLDESLDFTRYEMSFVGNSLIRFRNIRQVPPVGSSALADELRQHDIFITASLDDPCSNSLLEALHCGLPAVFRNSGGHPELADGGGEGFTGDGDVLIAIDSVANRYVEHRRAIGVKSLAAVGDSYLSFIDSIASGVSGQKLRKPAVLSLQGHLQFQAFRQRVASFVHNRLSLGGR